MRVKYTGENYSKDHIILDRFTRKLSSLIRAPFKEVLITENETGAAKQGFIIYVSLQSTKEWKDEIFYNSPYFVFKLSNKGNLKLQSMSRKAKEWVGEPISWAGISGVSWRDTKVKSIYQAASKINAFIYNITRK